jgi:hypothetical protein
VTGADDQSFRKQHACGGLDGGGPTERPPTFAALQMRAHRRPGQAMAAFYLGFQHRPAREAVLAGHGQLGGR